MSIINYQLSINIKNPVIERRRLQILPLYAIASLAIILLIPSIIIISTFYTYAIVLCSVTAFLFFVIPFILYKKNKLWKWNTRLRYSQSLLIGAIGIILLIHTHWLNAINSMVWCIAFAFLAKAEQCVFQPQQIIINTINISYSNILHPTTIAWSAIEKIVTRADYISIFKKNGRYIQFEITDNLSDTQLKEINELCTQLIIDNKQ